MKITSATFVGGVGGTSPLLETGLPQVAFIGRSNVGKSSVINSLTGVEGLAITSAFPGRTQEINIFLINKSLHLIDLPGYGYAKASRKDRERLQEIIRWYLFESPYVQQAVVFIIDAQVGLTESDMEMLGSLHERNKRIIVVANKVDKLRSSQRGAQLKHIQEIVGAYPVIPYSSTDHIGIRELTDMILT